jgi:hypothetical protein
VKNGMHDAWFFESISKRGFQEKRARKFNVTTGKLGKGKGLYVDDKALKGSTSHSMVSNVDS